MKILSLDGGGSWAMIQASCLLDLYGDISGHELLQKYDMVIANSGGSMVLACMIEDLRLSQIRNWFLDVNTRKSIFHNISIFGRSILENAARLEHIGPKYVTTEKLNGLRAHLVNAGGKYMSTLPAYVGKAALQIIICSYDYDHDREVFFRSSRTSLADGAYYELKMHNKPAAGSFGDITLAEAVHGSSNAPVNYFDKPAIARYQGDTYDRQFWDGALGGYNNPVFAGVLEALANGRTPAELQVISIGTGTNLLPLYKDQQQAPSVNTFMYQNEVSTFTNDIQKLATAIVADPPDSASFNAYTVIHGGLPAISTRFFRFSPLVKPHYTAAAGWQVPVNFSEAEFKQLVDLDMDAVEDAEVALIGKLCTEWMNPNGQIDNQAVRHNKMLEPIIGYGKYQEAKSAFLAHFRDNGAGENNVVLAQPAAHL